MALTSGKVKLPLGVTTTLLNKVRDTSVIAALSPSVPQKFADQTYMVFNPSSEAEVVAEGAKKGSYEQTLTPVEAKRVKVVTTTRVSDELTWADEQNQLEIIKNILVDQNGAIARALDYVVLHGINPKTGEAIADMPALSARAAQVTKGDDPTADIDKLTDALIDWDINGFALSRSFASELRKLRVPATGQRLYPEIPLSLGAGSVDGIPAAVSGTVNGRVAKEATNVEAFMGDWSLIKWGMVRDIAALLTESVD